MNRHKSCKKLNIFLIILSIVVAIGFFAYIIYSVNQQAVKSDKSPEESNRIYIEKQLEKAYEAENERLQQKELQQIISVNLPVLFAGETVLLRELAEMALHTRVYYRA